MLYKTIKIGELILKRMTETGIQAPELAEKLKIPESELMRILQKNDVVCSTLLRISKILDYDFFRIYSLNILLYAPPRMGFRQSQQRPIKGSGETQLPTFKKNTYTPEIIQHILNKIILEKASPIEMYRKYNIPKTTLYRWLKKYSSQTNA